MALFSCKKLDAPKILIVLRFTFALFLKVIKSYKKKPLVNYPISLAILKAAAAAITPTAVTLKAPHIGGCPVTLLL